MLVYLGGRSEPVLTKENAITGHFGYWVYYYNRTYSSPGSIYYGPDTWNYVTPIREIEDKYELLNFVDRPKLGFHGLGTYLYSPSTTDYNLKTMANDFGTLYVDGVFNQQYNSTDLYENGAAHFFTLHLSKGWHKIELTVNNTADPGYVSFFGTSTGDKITSIPGVLVCNTIYIKSSEDPSVDPVNDDRYTVSIPIASPHGGTYYTSQSVNISYYDYAPGVLTHYTTDGSIPDEYSTLYSGPISIVSSTTLRAIGMASGYNDSAIMNEVYAIEEAPLYDYIVSGALDPAEADGGYLRGPDDDYGYHTYTHSSGGLEFGLVAMIAGSSFARWTVGTGAPSYQTWYGEMGKTEITGTYTPGIPGGGTITVAVG